MLFHRDYCMFSSLTRLGLRILNELEKEREMGLTMSVPDLKRRLDVDMGMREVGWVVRDLNDAGLIGSKWKGRHLHFFNTGETDNATLYDLIMVVDGRIGFGSEYISGRFCSLPCEMTEAISVEEAISCAVSKILREIPLQSLLYHTSGDKQDFNGRPQFQI